MDTGVGDTETPSSSLSNAASSSSPSSGSGRPHSAGAVFSFNIPIGPSSLQSDTETVDSQELLAVIGDVDDDDEGEEEDDDDEYDGDDDEKAYSARRRKKDLVQQLTSHFESGAPGDTMLFLLPSAEASPPQPQGPVTVQPAKHLPYTPQPSSADSPHLLVQRQQRQGLGETDTSPSENKENTAPNSPLVASANYKQGNYFRFPDVDAWPSGSAKGPPAEHLVSSCSTPSDTLTLGILSPPDVLLPDAPRNSPMRRARLKSISLDSDSAKAVEDTLNMGMQELCMHPPPPSPFEQQQEESRSLRNKNQLKIDLKEEEFVAPDSCGVDSRQHPPTPKTPTLTQSRQKAISLDSDQDTSRPVPETSAHCVPTVSASVPTTPKRHLVLSTHQVHGYRSYHHHHHHQQQYHHQREQQQPPHHHHQKVSHHQPHHMYHQAHQPPGSTFFGTTGNGSCRTKSRSTSEHLGSNLQRLKTVTLSVSNNNLKTLPEVMPLSDFGSPPMAMGLSKSSTITPLSMEAASPFVGNTTPLKGRSSLLQRRGSNHSLTLNLAGSVGDLSGSSSHIVPSASGSGFGTKRGLLQRRGSNASLTLNIQGSDSALSRYNSHGSLNEARVHRKSHLSVSNCNLRSSLEVGRLRGTPGSKAGHHGKFFSSEENLNNNSSKNKLSYCQIDPIDGAEKPAMGGSAELVDFDDDGGVRQITTKPLSPQSTSEDFKIYLANIQYLQNASNVLRVEDIRDLGAVFNDLAAYAALELQLGGSAAAAQLTLAQERHLNGQRMKLRKIHQEFWDLPTNHQEKPMVFGSQHKNRYKTILPNEHSRVILKPELGDVTRTEPYINANYIKGPTDGTHELNYIATQGPMANTVFDFWLMAMQDTAGELGPTLGNHTHNKMYSASFADSYRTCPVIVAEDTETDEGAAAVSVPSPPLAMPTHRPPAASPSAWGDSREAGEKLYILMLTNFMENGRPKCATYFPERCGAALCFYSGSSGSESQSESRNPAATCPFASTSSPSPPLSAGVDDWAEVDGEQDTFRQWYNRHVRDDGLTDWQWIKGLRRSSAAPSETGSDSCFVVRNVGLREENGYSVRQLAVKYVNGPARVCYRFQVEHYWFPDWPDHKSPEDLHVVLDFALDLLRVPGLTMSLRTPDSGIGTGALHLGGMGGIGSGGVGGVGGSLGAKVVLPILHCSAGIGRTGCMAGILNALRQLHSSGTSSSSAAATAGSFVGQSQTVDILGIVCNLRLQRGGMVQNSEQYELIHRVLCLYQQKVDEADGIFAGGAAEATNFLQAPPPTPANG